MKSHLPCRRCGATERGNPKTGKLTGPCLPCRRIASKTYYENNKEKCIQSAIQWRKDNPNKVKVIEKQSHLKKRYGISLDEYYFLCVEQDQRCAICNIETLLVVDHCHITNSVRRLLCRSCNQGLGHFKDNIYLMEKAIAYLEEFNDTPTE